MVVVLLRFQFCARSLIGGPRCFNGNRFLRKGKAGFVGRGIGADLEPIIRLGVQIPPWDVHMRAATGKKSGGRRLWMNRNVLIGLAVVLAAGLGYYQFSYVPAQRAAEEAAAAAKAAEEAAAAAAAEAEAAAAAEAEAAAAAAAEAEAAAAAAAEAAADAVTEAAEGAAAAVTEAAEGAADAVAGAAGEAAEAVGGVQQDAAAALDPANFDAARISALIDASALDATTKTTLKAAVEAAASNPALVQTAVDQVRSALGL